MMGPTDGRSDRPESRVRSWGLFLMQGPYADHIVDASDVCNNCLRRIRVERIDPTRAGLVREFETTLTRNRRTTVVDHGPAESVTDQQGTFCEACGTESAYDRWWADADIDDDRFRDLVQQLLRTLDEKGVTVARKRVAAHALQARRDGDSVDEALATGVEAGLQSAVARDSDTPDTARADS
jgi:hypothetical protein